MYRLYMALASSLLVMCLMLASYLVGDLPWAGLIQSVTMVLLTGAVFYVIFRSKRNLRYRDPNLTIAQMAASTTVILYAMYVVNAGRSVFLIVLLMIFLFGVLQLTIRPLLACAAGILLGYGAVIALLWRWRPEALDVGHELLQWGALVITLPWFAVMGGFISALRQRSHQRNEELHGLLQRVQASEAGLAQAQRIAGLGGWTFDPVQRSATFSLETYRLFGLDPTRAAPFGEEILDLLHPQDRQRYLDMVQPALYQGHAFEGEFRILWPGGEVRWMHAIGEPVIDEHSCTTLLRGTIRDISLRKQIEQRQAMEYSVTALLAKAKTMDDAAPKIIETICAALGADGGAFWNWDQQVQMLRCHASWSTGTPTMMQFLQWSNQQCFAPDSHGLVGRVWGCGEPVWIADIGLDPHILYADIGLKLGLCGAFAFPVGVGPALYGVMEFYLPHACPHDPALLALTRAIGSQIGQFIARKAAEEEIRQLAFYDPLTSLPNRRLLSDRLQRALAASARGKCHGALLFIDLDNFKTINDTLGHGKGDLLLQQVAARLTSCVRQVDTVGRQGGDEFVVMLMDLNEAAPEATLQAQAIGEKIRSALNQPYDLAGHLLYSSASVGATLFDGHSASSADLLTQADLAMYQAKALGRNALRFFDA